MVKISTPLRHAPYLSHFKRDAIPSAPRKPPALRTVFSKFVHNSVKVGANIQVNINTPRRHAHHGSLFDSDAMPGAPRKPRPSFPAATLNSSPTPLKSVPTPLKSVPTPSKSKHHFMGKLGKAGAKSQRIKSLLKGAKGKARPEKKAKPQPKLHRSKSRFFSFAHKKPRVPVILILTTVSLARLLA